jgi:hypothetical protein
LGIVQFLLQILVLTNFLVKFCLTSSEIGLNLLKFIFQVSALLNLDFESVFQIIIVMLKSIILALELRIFTRKGRNLGSQVVIVGLSLLQLSSELVNFSVELWNFLRELDFQGLVFILETGYSLLKWSQLVQFLDSVFKFKL